MIKKTMIKNDYYQIIKSIKDYQLIKSLAQPLVMAKLNKTYDIYTNLAKLLLSTSPYHLVPKHLLPSWPRPEQSPLLLEACSPNGTDNCYRQQRQRRTKRPLPEPSDILKRVYALYDDKLRYYKKKVLV